MPFYRDSVVIVRPPTRTLRAGDEVPDLRAAALLTGTSWAGVQVRPIIQTERIDSDRDVKRAQWRIASKPGSPDVDLQAGDLIRLRSGEVTAVLGDPARPVNPLTRPPRLDHVEVTVQEVTS